MSAEELTDGITRIMFGESEYTFWNKAEIVLPSIYKYLKSNFPFELILSEFNHIDFVVLGENLPVEVQSTIIFGRSHSGKKNIGSSYFEQMIEKQIKQNIERYGKCWFFFDSEFLRYLNTQMTRANRLDLDWLLDYMRNDLLKVFVINYKGEVRPILVDDLESIKDRVSYEELGNKEIDIFSHVLFGNGYTSKEIRSFHQNKIRLQDKSAFISWLRKKEQAEREKKLGYILFTISSDLRLIDEFFALHEIDWNRVSTAASFLGILHYEKGTKLWCIEDYYDVNKYFPSYNKNKMFWDNLKHKQFKKEEFKNIILEAR